MTQNRLVKHNTLLNRAELKRYILEQAKVVRPGWEVTRVSKKAMDEIEAFIKIKIKVSLRMQPTKGKTFKSFY